MKETVSFNISELSQSQQEGSEVNNQNQDQVNNNTMNTIDLAAYNENDFHIEMDNIDIGDEIGMGMFSKVFIGKYFDDLVAIKIQKRKEKEMEGYLVREILALKNLEHENLITYLGATNIERIIHRETMTKSYELVIVTEYCPNGDLLHLLLKDPTHNLLGWKFRLHVLRDALSGILFLHENELIHRDIKTCNMLLDGSWRCKITDFGMVREAGRRMTICGTDEYMAPEMLFGDEYSYPVDIYCLGMCVLEMITRLKIGNRENEFAKRHPRDNFVLDFENAVKPFFPEDTPTSLILFAEQCLQEETADRLTIQECFDWIDDLYDTYDDEKDGMIPDPEMEKLPDYAVQHYENSMRNTITEEIVLEDKNNNNNNNKNIIIGKEGKEEEKAEKDLVVVEDDDVHTGQTKTETKTTTTTETMMEGVNHVIVQKEKIVITRTKSIKLDFKPIEKVYKEGWLYKRNKSGFKNWKKRWFVLDGCQLTWYVNPKEIETKGSLLARHGITDLSGVNIQKVSKTRFKLITSDNSMNILNNELAGENTLSCYDWIISIEEAISRAALEKINNDDNTGYNNGNDDNTGNGNVDDKDLEEEEAVGNEKKKVERRKTNFNYENIYSNNSDNGSDNENEMVYNYGTLDNKINFKCVNSRVFGGKEIYYKVISKIPHKYSSSVYVGYDDLKLMYNDISYNIRLTKEDIAMLPSLPDKAIWTKKERSTFLGGRRNSSTDSLENGAKIISTFLTSFLKVILSFEDDIIFNTFLTFLELPDHRT